MRIDIIIIFFIAVVFVIIPIKNNRLKKLIYWIFFIPLVILAGWREIGIDQDSVGYVNYYDSNYIDILTEPSFVWISKFVRFVFNDVRYLFVIYAALGISLKFIAIKQLTPLLFLSLIVYISKVYGLYDLNAIRASISASILLFCIRPLAERKFLVLMFLTIIAILFHYSAILFLPLLFLTDKDLSRKAKIIMAIIPPVSYLIYFLDINLIMTIPIPLIKLKLEAYSELESTGKEGVSNVNVFSLVQLARCLIFYYLLYFYDELKLKIDYLSIMMKLYLISLILLPLFASLAIVALRGASLFAIVDVILLPLIYYTIKPKIFGKLVVVLISIFYLFFYLYIAEVVYK